MKWIEICRGMGSEREIGYWACPGVAVAKQPIS